MAEHRYAVYWQPGCTSCLKAKEFLARHGIGFESVNVRTTPGARERLERLGARSIPVILRGEDWTYGQDLDDVARFVGVPAARDRLPPADLVLRLDRLLAAARRHTAQLPDAVLEALLPGRADRSAADLAWHIAMIVEGFLDAAGGGALTFDYFERRPAGADRSRAQLRARQAQAAARLAAWWTRSADRLPATIETYYGNRSLATVLERTAWHVAQHARQLESLVGAAGLGVDGPLGEAELAGLPLPTGLWDPEAVAMA